MSRKANLTQDDLNSSLADFRTKLLSDIKEEFTKQLEELKSIIINQTVEINNLKSEIGIQAERIEQLEHKKLADIHKIPLNSNSTTEPTFADVVRHSVKSVLQDQLSHKEVIIFKLKGGQNESDSVLFSNLCEKIDFPIKPLNLQRLGPKPGVPQNSAAPRPLKATFSTSFDARALLSRFNQAKHNDPGNFSNIRIRLGKTAEEREIFVKNIKMAQELNNEAKEVKANHSFSVRDNGEIWKFQKNETTGKWARVRDWSLTK